ncbi:MAG: hypothetical protein OEM61_05715, partial [Desulfobacteraceae bacterium]|nr:hypothetical protein [Desulfobacteraceae bacterium]
HPLLPAQKFQPIGGFVGTPGAKIADRPLMAKTVVTAPKRSEGWVWSGRRPDRAPGIWRRPPADRQRSTS